jgi:SBP domain
MQVRFLPHSFQLGVVCAIRQLCICRLRHVCNSLLMMPHPAVHRFCQQCGRFQTLAEFRGDRRSCDAALAAHNARRRVMHGSEIETGGKERRAATGKRLQWLLRGSDRVCDPGSTTDGDDPTTSSSSRQEAVAGTRSIKRRPAPAATAAAVAANDAASNDDGARVLGSAQQCLLSGFTGRANSTGQACGASSSRCVETRSYPAEEGAADNVYQQASLGHDLSATTMTKEAVQQQLQHASSSKSGSAAGSNSQDVLATFQPSMVLPSDTNAGVCCAGNAPLAPTPLLLHHATSSRAEPIPAGGHAQQHVVAAAAAAAATATTGVAGNVPQRASATDVFGEYTPVPTDATSLPPGTKLLPGPHEHDAAVDHMIELMLSSVPEWQAMLQLPNTAAQTGTAASTASLPAAHHQQNQLQQERFPPFPAQQHWQQQEHQQRQILPHQPQLLQQEQQLVVDTMEQGLPIVRQQQNLHAEQRLQPCSLAPASFAPPAVQQLPPPESLWAPQQRDPSQSASLYAPAARHDQRLVRLSLKLHGVTPDQLPPATVAALNRLLTKSAEELEIILLAPAVRNGCVFVELDLLVRCCVSPDDGQHMSSSASAVRHSSFAGESSKTGCGHRSSSSSRTGSARASCFDDDVCKEEGSAVAAAEGGDCSSDAQQQLLAEEMVRRIMPIEKLVDALLQVPGSVGANGVLLQPLMTKLSAVYAQVGGSMASWVRGCDASPWQCRQHGFTPAADTNPSLAGTLRLMDAYSDADSDSSNSSSSSSNDYAAACSEGQGETGTPVAELAHKLSLPSPCCHVVARPPLPLPQGTGGQSASLRLSAVLQYGISSPRSTMLHGGVGRHTDDSHGEEPAARIWATQRGRFLLLSTWYHPDKHPGQAAQTVEMLLCGASPGLVLLTAERPLVLQQQQQQPIKSSGQGNAGGSNAALSSHDHSSSRSSSSGSGSSKTSCMSAPQPVFVAPTTDVAREVMGVLDRHPAAAARRLLLHLGLVTDCGELLRIHTTAAQAAAASGGGSGACGAAATCISPLYAAAMRCALCPVHVCTQTLSLVLMSAVCCIPRCITADTAAAAAAAAVQQHLPLPYASCLLFPVAAFRLLGYYLLVFALNNSMAATATAISSILRDLKQLGCADTAAAVSSAPAMIAPSSSSSSSSSSSATTTHAGGTSGGQQHTMDAAQRLAARCHGNHPHEVPHPLPGTGGQGSAAAAAAAAVCHQSATSGDAWDCDSTDKKQCELAPTKTMPAAAAAAVSPAAAVALATCPMHHGQQQQQSPLVILRGALSVVASMILMYVLLAAAAAAAKGESVSNQLQQLVMQASLSFRLMLAPLAMMVVGFCIAVVQYRSWPLGHLGWRPHRDTGNGGNSGGDDCDGCVAAAAASTAATYKAETGGSTAAVGSAAASCKGVAATPTGASMPSKQATDGLVGCSSTY